MEVTNQTARITINVSGHKFTTTRQTLLNIPTTRLGKLATSEESFKPGAEIFFDADEDVFREVLRYHRTGELHVPNTICYQTFIHQLKFWDVEMKEIMGCCLPETDEACMEEQFVWLERSDHILENSFTNGSHASLRTKLWTGMTNPSNCHNEYKGLSKLWALCYLSMTIGQAITLATLTLPSESQRFGMDSIYHALNKTLAAGEFCWTVKVQLEIMPTSHQWRANFFFLIFFFLEIVVRFTCCPDKRYFLTSIHLLDVIAVFMEALYVILLIIAVSWSDMDETTCELITAVLFVVVVSTNLRSFRVISIITYWRRMKVLILALYSSGREVLLLLIIIGITCLIGGPLVFYCNTFGAIWSQAENPPNMDSIPRSYWWILVTMTTVGFGDFYPTNLIGYIAAAVIIVLGLIMTALPVAIIGTHFAIYYDYSIRRKKKNRKSAGSNRKDSLEMLSDGLKLKRESISTVLANEWSQGSYPIGAMEHTSHM